MVKPTCPNMNLSLWRTQARQHAAEAMAELVAIVQNSSNDAARLAAIRVILDRGFGKPPQSVQIAIEDPNPAAY